MAPERTGDVREAMVSTGDDRDRQIAELREQVAALEEIVRRRSDELRLLQKLACPKDRLMIGSIFDGGAMREIQLASIDQYYAMGWFAETTNFVPSSVEAALDEAWQSAPTRPAEAEETS